MSEPKSQLGESLMKFAEAALVDLPVALTLRAFRREADKEVYQAGWKAYDAVVGVATDLTNRAYTNPTAGRVAGRVIERTLRVQRLADAVAGAFFAVLWPGIGLPSASDVGALRLEVRSLREEIRSARDRDKEVSVRVLDEFENARGEAQPAQRPIFENPLWAGWQDKPKVKTSVSAW